MTAPRPRRSDDIESSTAPDALPDDLRRDDRRLTPPDSMPPREGADDALIPAGGGFTPAEDGGNKNHPMHDDDPAEDATPRDYEREIDRLDAAAQRG